MELRFDEVFGKSNIDLVSNISAKNSFSRFMKEVVGSALIGSHISVNREMFLPTFQYQGMNGIIRRIASRHLIPMQLG
jgi:hypothetical protein